MGARCGKIAPPRFPAHLLHHANYASCIAHYKATRERERVGADTTERRGRDQDGASNDEPTAIDHVAPRLFVPRAKTGRGRVNKRSGGDTEMLCLEEENKPAAATLCSFVCWVSGW